jgi:hypothetical protein
LRRTITALAAACALVASFASADALAATSVAVHGCGSGYTHAVLSYGHRCLRRGQFCSMGEQSRYRRLEYRCVGGRLR